MQASNWLALGTEIRSWAKMCGNWYLSVKKSEGYNLKILERDECQKSSWK
jgi:hypothetical protein